MVLVLNILVSDGLLASHIVVAIDLTPAIVAGYQKPVGCADGPERDGSLGEAARTECLDWWPAGRGRVFADTWL